MVFDPCVRKIPCRRKWQPSPEFLPGESHGQQSWAGYSLQGCKKLVTTETVQHSTRSACQSNNNSESPAAFSFPQSVSLKDLVLLPCRAKILKNTSWIAGPNPSIAKIAYMLSSHWMIPKLSIIFFFSLSFVQYVPSEHLVCISECSDHDVCNVGSPEAQGLKEPRCGFTCVR